MIYYLYIVIMTMMGSFAGLFLKNASFSKTLKSLLKNKYFYLGGFIYFITALINIYVLKYLPYSIVLPSTSLTYVWSLLVAKIFLNENITTMKVVGIGLIVTGALVLVL